MTIDLLTPILVPELRAVNFFNGRLVSGEDMTDEQNAQRAAHELLGASIGDGVVEGLQVAESSFDSTAETPLLAVRSGIAVNRLGEVLRLPNDTLVRLVRPPVTSAVAEAVEVFHACTPPQQAAQLVPSAVYVLTICSSRSGAGKTATAGMGALRTHCNIRWIVDSVEFRLVNLNVSEDLLSTPERIRNRVAYACFGTNARREYSVSPFGTPRTPATLLDALRASTALTDCDVPLAILQWKTEGVQFVDLWSVRRRCSSGSTAAGELAFSGRASSVADAMQNQFASQLDDLRASVADAATIEARSSFRHLPPAGLLPVSSSAVRRFDYETFFQGKTCSRPWFIQAADVEPILAESIHYPPVDLDSLEMVWIYLVHENRARAAGEAPFFVIFANANIPFYGDARFHRSHFDFSNLG